MRGLVIIGIALNLIGVVTAMVTLPEWRGVLGLVGLPLVAVGVGGAVLVKRGVMPHGAWAIVASGIGLLPFGAVSIVAGLQARTDFRLGAQLGRDANETPRRSRPRAWTLAAVVFGASALAGLAYALLVVGLARFETVGDALTVLAGALVMVLAGLEAILLWTAQPAAQRLGIALGLIGLGVLALAGFYLHSYVAVSLLALPIYALYLVWSGRERWTGLAGQGR